MADKQKWHPSVTLERVTEASKRYYNGLDNPGICVLCGIDTPEGVEPDARCYTCESCGDDGVYGAEELLLMMS